MKLGELISKYREEHGMSLRAFSRLAGLSATYVSMLEKGVNGRGSVPTPSVDTYRAIASAMGMDLDQLIRAVDDKIDISPSTQDDDAELMEYLEYLRTRPEARILMSTMRGATKEEVEENVRFIEALRKTRQHD